MIVSAPATYRKVTAGPPLSPGDPYASGNPLCRRFANQLREIGTDFKYIQCRLGHTSIATTQACPPLTEKRRTTFSQPTASPEDQNLICELIERYGSVYLVDGGNYKQIINKT